MRTTFDIQDEVLGRLRQHAAKTNRRLGDIVTDALLAMFDRLSRGAPEAKRDAMPMDDSGGRGLMPGIDLEDNATLHEFLDRPGTPESGTAGFEHLR